MCWPISAALVLPLNTLLGHPQLQGPRCSSSSVDVTFFKWRSYWIHSTLPWHVTHYLLYYFWRCYYWNNYIDQYALYSVLIMSTSLSKIMGTKWTSRIIFEWLINPIIIYYPRNIPGWCIMPGRGHFKAYISMKKNSCAYFVLNNTWENTSLSWEIYQLSQVTGEGISELPFVQFP